jgi:hypothetical protein
MKKNPLWKKCALAHFFEELFSKLPILDDSFAFQFGDVVIVYNYI